MNPTKIFIRYLNQTSVILDKAEICSQQQGISEFSILNSALQSDMFPLFEQIQICAEFSLRACCPLAKLEVPNFKGGDVTFKALRSQISRTIDFLQNIPEQEFSSSTPEQITEKAGFNDLQLSADDFLWLYAMPNFFFHLNMAYAILRSKGIPLSKGDFDGYHDYPRDFRF